MEPILFFRVMDVFDDDDDLLSTIDLDGLVSSSIESENGSRLSDQKTTNSATKEKNVGETDTVSLKSIENSSNSTKKQDCVISSYDDDDDDDLLSAVDLDGIVASSNKNDTNLSSILTSSSRANGAKTARKIVASKFIQDPKITNKKPESKFGSTTTSTTSHASVKVICGGAQKTGIDKYFPSCGARKTGVNECDGIGDKNNNSLSTEKPSGNRTSLHII
jgi:hypothetical protein